MKNKFKRIAKTFLSILLIGTSTIAISLGGSHAGSKEAADLERAEKAYQQALKDWQEDKDTFEKYLKEYGDLQQQYYDAEQKYWATRQNVERKHAGQLRASRERRNEYETEYREKVRECDELDFERDEASAEFKRLDGLVNKGLANAVEKIRRGRLERKLHQINERQKIILLERKELHENFKTSEAQHTAEREKVWQLRPKSDQLASLDDWYTQKTSELTRPLTSFDVEEDRGRAETTAEKLLTTLLRNAPPIVTKVEAVNGSTTWYSAVMETDPLATGETPTGANAEAYKDAIAEIEKEIKKLDAEINSGNIALKQIRQDWEEFAYEEAWASQAIADNELYTAYTLAGIEIGAVVASFAVSGGLAAPAAQGAATSFMAYLGVAANKYTPELIASTSKMLMQTMKSHGARKAIIYVGKAMGPAARKSAKTHGINYLQHVSEMFASKGANFLLNDADYLFNYHGLTAPASIAVGDVVELTLTGGAKDVLTLVTQTGSKAALTDARNALGIAAAATASKVIIRTLVDLRADSLAWDAAVAGAGASNTRIAYFATAAVRNAYRVRKQYLEEAKASFEALLEHGPRSKRKTVNADVQLEREDFDKIGQTEIHFHFSMPLDNPPIITSPGIVLTTPKPFVGSNKIWTVEILEEEVPDETREIPLTIALAPSEKPFNQLDSKPQTALRLEGLARDRWLGYEQGSDQNHALRLVPEGEKPELEPLFPKDYVKLQCPRQMQSTFFQPVFTFSENGAASIAYYTKNGARFDFAYCRHFNPVKNTCHDEMFGKFSEEEFVVASDKICLSESGALLRSPNGEIYSQSFEHYYDGEVQFTPPEDAYLPQNLGRYLQNGLNGNLLQSD